MSCFASFDCCQKKILTLAQCYTLTHTYSHADIRRHTCSLFQLFLWVIYSFLFCFLIFGFCLKSCFELVSFLINALPFLLNIHGSGENPGKKKGIQIKSRCSVSIKEFDGYCNDRNWI